MKIFCNNCDSEMDCELVAGNIIYGSAFYSDKLYYRCSCGCYVGTHKGTENPLGTIPTPQMRKWRLDIHSKLDPLWKNAKRRSKARGRVYGYISKQLGYEYHTANISSEGEYLKVLDIIEKLKNQEWINSILG